MEIHRDVDGVNYITIVDKSGLVHPRTIPPVFPSAAETDVFLKGLLPYASRSTSYNSQLLEVEMLKRLIVLIGKTGVQTIPTTESSWQDLIDSCYTHNLSDRTIRLNKRTELWAWHHRKQFEYLRDIQNIVPPAVDIPPRKGFRKPRKFGSTQKTVNTPSRSAADVESPSGELLVNIDISRKDAAYLDAVKTSLIDSMSDVEADLITYVKAMAEHFAYGEKLLALCSEGDWRAIQEKYDRVQTNMHDSPYNAVRNALECDALEQRTLPGSTEISLARILRSYQDTRTVISFRTAFQKSPWLPSFQQLKLPGSCPAAPTPQFSITRRFAWMCGHINVTDLTVVHALLLIRNPSFNALPLFDGVIRDKHDRSMFELVVDGIAFSVDKRRVASLKKHTLDEVSQFAVDTLLKMTAAARSLMAKNNALRDRLFFQQDCRGARAVHYTSLYAFAGEGDHARRIHAFLPKVASNDAIVHINPARLRASIAVIEWFRTGSVTAAAHKLNNTTEVVLKNYIPEVLIHAWNTRLIRRFHNLTLCVATAHESYLLASTDFQSVDELQAFISDMLNQHAASSSKLAELLHAEFGATEDDSQEDSTDTADSSLVIPISPETLTALYAFRDNIYMTGFHSSEHRVEHNGVLPSSVVVDLADLLCARLPTHENQTYRRVHEQAMSRAPDFLRHIDANSRMTISPLEPCNG
ncbi:hypothetical protein [Paraburkholderia sp. 35.1]|uniref:hypothetical protein n=1 Tax=Paraburkholderia sp. 35.1 TaxID=2991058 RepID=UPI003D240BD0